MDGLNRLGSEPQGSDNPGRKTERVFAICEAKHVEVLILNQGEETTFEEELAQDVLEIMTVFSARLYGSRSRKNQKWLEGVKHAVEGASS